METSPYEFNLSNILKYSKGGDFQETASIIIDGPSFQNFSECAPMAQAVAKALIQNSKGQEVDSTSEQPAGGQIDGGAVRIILFNSDADMQDLVGKFAKLCERCAFADEEKTVRLNKTLFEKLSLNDALECMFGYIANFIIPLALPQVQAPGE